MFDLLALAVAIISFVLLFQLRSVLSFTIDTLSVKEAELPPSDTLVDLLSPLEEDLKSLGFNGPGQLEFTEITGPDEFTSQVSIFTHANNQVTFWCHSPINIAEPNNLIHYWTTELQDGRVLTSQAFDPYFEFVATPLTPAQTLSEPCLEKQLKLHQNFVSRFDSAPNTESTEPTHILYQAAEARNSSVQQLIQDGRVNTDKNNVNRVSFAAALKMMRLLITRKKPENPGTSVPNTRLLVLAQKAKITRERSPNIGIQMALFTLSLLLSIVIGTLIWDLEFALLLLGVVIFHELGHYLAMRAFGYRNVHIMALPLVGGVTMGFDSNPNAWRQAWMSLMGPVPGILLGWAILVGAIWFDGLHDFMDSLLPIFGMLLFINYLNILPILPLDGGHVLQALLPPKRLIIKAVITFITCTMGALIAYYFEFYLLTALALLQMLTLPGQIKMAKLVGQLYENHESQAELTYSQQLSTIFTAQQDFFGACKNATKRINQAENILQILNTQPMKGWQRGIISLLLALLLIVPIAAIGFGFGMSFDNAYDLEYWDKQEEARAERTQSYQEIMQELSISQLIAGIQASDSPDTPCPIPEQSNTTLAQQDLINPLPKQLRAVYESGADLDRLTIITHNEIKLANNVTDTLAEFGDGEHITVTDGQNEEYQEQLIAKQDLGNWLLISDPKLDSHYLLLEPDTENQNGRFIEWWYDMGQIYPSLRAWLQQQWINTQENEFQIQQHQMITQQQYQSLRTMDIPQMLNEYQQAIESPTGYQWLIDLLVEPGDQNNIWTAAATDEQISATEQRLDIQFSAAIKSFYQQHNGLKTLLILPVEQLEWITDETNIKQQTEQFDNTWQKLQDDGSLQLLEEKKPTFNDCISIAGYGAINLPNDTLMANSTMLWCPSNNQATIINLTQAYIYDDFESWLRYKVAEITKQP